MDDHFRNLKIIFDTTFCGDWAGNTWNQTSCGSLAPTCEEYVSKNPEAFAEAYWAVNTLQVFQDDGSSNSTDAPPVPAPASSPSSVPSSPVAPPTSNNNYFDNNGDDDAAETQPGGPGIAKANFRTNGRFVKNAAFAPPAIGDGLVARDDDGDGDARLRAKWVQRPGGWGSREVGGGSVLARRG